jgi:hypothetical protein
MSPASYQTAPPRVGILATRSKLGQYKVSLRKGLERET